MQSRSPWSPSKSPLAPRVCFIPSLAFMCPVRVVSLFIRALRGKGEIRCEYDISLVRGARHIVRIVWYKDGVEVYSFLFLAE